MTDEKLLVSVLLPATRRSYEFRVPLDLTVQEVAFLISRILAAREPIRYEASGFARLMYLDGVYCGTLADPSSSIRSLVLEGALVNGSAVELM